MATITGIIPNGITITVSGSYTSPLTIATGGTVDVASGSAIYSSVYASVVNYGSVDSWLAAGVTLSDGRVTG